MRQLMFLAPGKLEWWEVPAPVIQGPGEALVRPLAVARCDLDAGLLAGIAPFRGKLLHFLRNHLPEDIGQKRLFRNAPFKGPFALGHEGVAEVLAVGEGVTQLRPGDRVIVPFQISCGECAHCRRGLTNSCLSVPPRSMYGFGALGGECGGFLSDVVRVPFADHMLVPLPAGLSPEAAASMSDNIPDAYRAIGPLLRARPGASVLIVGGGAQSIGLYAAGLAVALGAAQVDYLDPDPARCAIAEAFGANAIVASPPERAGSYAITVDASADPKGLHCALLSTEPGGTCTSVGIYYTATTPLPLLAMYGTGLTFVTGRANARADLCDCLHATQHHGFCPERVTTLTAAWDDAAEAFLDPGPKVVVSRG